MNLDWCFFLGLFWVVNYEWLWYCDGKHWYVFFMVLCVVCVHEFISSKFLKKTNEDMNLCF